MKSAWCSINLKTVAYVIRLVEFTPPTKTLLLEFESYPLNQYIAAAAEDYREALRAWTKAMQTSAGLAWQRKADEQTQSSGDGPRTPEPFDDSD